jgi:hypothetical protein
LAAARRALYDFRMSTAERRRHRSDHPLEALELQLEACRQAGDVDGMVLSDGDGLLLAAVGNRAVCDEIAVQLPQIGRRVGEFRGVLLSAERALRVHMRRFRVGVSDLYIAVIGSGERDSQTLAHGLGGASRILGDRISAATN